MKKWMAGFQRNKGKVIEKKILQESFIVQTQNKKVSNY